MNLIKLIFKVLLLLALAGCFFGCESAKIGQPELANTYNQTQEYLPFKIKWITALYPAVDEKDTNRPVEGGTPTLDGDRVYVGSSHGFLYAVDRNDGRIIWKFKAYGGVESAPAVYGDNVIFGDSDGNVYSLFKKSGRAAWSFKVQGEVFGRIAVYDKKVLLTTTYNRIYALNADSGEWIWTHQRALPEGFSIRGISSPVTDGERVYAGLADGFIIAVDLQRGREIWKSYLRRQDERFLDVDATPVIIGDLLYVAGFDGSLHCMKKENGDPVWNFGNGGLSKALVEGDRIYLSGSKGFVYALNRETGEQLWRFDVREYDQRKAATKSLRRKLRIPTPPVLRGNFLIFASSYGFLYVLDSTTGRLLWDYLPGYGLSSQIIMADDGIYFQTNSAMLFKMQPSIYPPAPF